MNIPYINTLILMEKQYFLHLVTRQMDSAGCLPDQRLSVDFTCWIGLKTRKVLVEPSFNKNEWVTDWSI